MADLRMGIDHIHTGQYVAAAPPGDLFRRLKDGRLARLTINGASLDRLLSAPDWGPVRTLAVHGGFTADAIGRLLMAPQAQRLEWLLLAADYDERRPFRMAGLDAVLRRAGLLPNLKRLSLVNLPGEFLAASFCRHLLRLDVGTRGLYEPGLAPVVSADLSALRFLTVNGVRPEHELEPLATATNMPNLCTVRDGYFGDFSPDWLSRLANNRAMPHLSLLGTEEGWSKWWVLGDGQAIPATWAVNPLDEDLWEPDPLVDWFW